MSMDENGAGSIATPERSDGKSKRLRLKCDPARLPDPPLAQPKVKKISELSKEAAIQVKDFYREQKYKRKSTLLKNHKRNRRTD